MKLRSYGTMGVDWEQRVDYERLRTERLARIKKMLKQSEIGSLLCFDMNNIRYITNTTIGTWAMDKLGRFCLLPQDDDPINWDFGSAAQASHAVRALAGRRAFAGGDFDAARRDAARRSPRRRRGAQNPHRTGGARLAQRAGRRRCGRTAGAVRACRKKG